MRRLALALAVLASLVLVVTSGAVAANSGPHLAIKGAAHASGGRLQGAFTVQNTGTAKAAALTATVKLVSTGKKPTRLTAQRASVPALAPGDKRQVKVKATVPGKAQPGWSILACAGQCVKIGTLTAHGGAGPRPKKAVAPNAPTVPTPSPPTPQPPAPPTLCPIPSAAINYVADEPVQHAGCGVEYWVLVPSSYNAATPAPLLIWLHGCFGESFYDVSTVSPATEGKAQDWISLTLIGREEPGNECWTPSVDETKVLQALADVETHLNVNTHRVILGGYSSGGDLAYRTGFRHSSTFAGLLIENSSPFRDTESTQAESLAAATTKFHIVHLAHRQDTTYALAGVQSETNAVKAAGFPLELIERDGTHYDEPGEIVNGNPVPGTDADLRTYLLPHIDDGWTSP
ncbi:MAG TPA: hypothetical protein VJL81_07090 [Solirubrobacterales bacterium]|nr:hypothetical protein [Solirubrobacterales bacterium]